MKNLFLLLLAFITINVQAQKKIEKEAAYEDHVLEIKLDFASSIEVVTWDKPVVRIRAMVETEDPRYTEMFSVGLEERGNALVINSNAKDVFKAYQKAQGLSIDGIVYSKGLDHEFNYQLMIPKDVEVEMSSITGDIFSDYLEGEFTIDVINGDVKIDEFVGVLKIDVINGRIELPGKNSSIAAKTVTGSIEATEGLSLHRKEKFIGEELMLQKVNSENSVFLETVNGTIILN